MYVSVCVCVKISQCFGGRECGRLHSTDKMDSPSPAFRSPFSRPWMNQTGAAAAAAAGSMGLKGIVAGNGLCQPLFKPL